MEDSGHDRWLFCNGCAYKDKALDFSRCQHCHEGSNFEKWISVKDRMPEDDLEVLVTIKDERPYKGKTLISYYVEICAWHSYLNVWTDSSTNRLDSSFGRKTVTYWMPLPKPYKEE